MQIKTSDCTLTWSSFACDLFLETKNGSKTPEVVLEGDVVLSSPPQPCCLDGVDVGWGEVVDVDVALSNLIAKECFVV
jgi:hypothetical protein